MVKLNSYQKRMAEESGHQALRDLHNARLLVLALGIAAIVLTSILLIAKFAKGFLANVAVLLGIVIGAIVASAMPLLVALGVTD